ncbi:hypothetical protein K3G39_02270 [Pontibacter sp. HSC-14F20]|uniref:hypothetical protein n=1 Tax=Pontibacter sp. HSC-14F20 TaxID=2864136 RepID=UPI001C72E148|nr:hypothetical protein [Pontibacter sp. HSC-14F20]MBX0332054.1 hypothetical protein [Pontibacter sp. HSC-14F20]
MNKSAFLKLIKQVSDISDQQQSELEQVAAAFPYCQTAHLLLAKSAYDKGSMLSTQRLRRASAYATDRQLLKRLIYASPVLESVYTEEEENIALAEETESIPVEDLITEEADTSIDLDQTITEPAETVDAIPNAEEPISEESLDDVYSPAPVEESPYLPDDSAEEETETPDAEIDSELALLFTFNSISSSSTDLLRERDEEENAAEIAVETEYPHHAEAAQVLQDLEDVHEEESEPFAADSFIEHEAIPDEQTEITQVELTLAALPAAETEDELYAEETEEEQQASDEDAQINYSFDEIDRLYAEDALGYWMGSSRMGEVLQLKDDYTRTRPQSFHPELILEYSKTHELEKAIQPTAHVLSKQLDIIDQFLKLNPRLKTMASLKLKPEPQEDLSLKSSKIKKGMASESLANIFIKQGKPKKAVKIYEQLILKYPEKKSYFAEQIEKLQNIT